MPAELLDKSLRNRWNSFVEKSPQGSIFSYFEWLEFSTGNDFEILVFTENSEIISGMPLPFFSTKKIKMPLLTQKIGVLYGDFTKLKYSKRLEKEKKIIYGFIDFLRLKKIKYSMNFDKNFDNWLPFYWKGYKQTTKYTYIIDFNEKNTDRIWKDMDQNTRNTIKKAENSDLKISRCFDIKKFYKFNTETFKRQNIKIPYSFEYVDKMYSIFKDNIVIFKAVDPNNKIHAMNFYIRDKKSVYYLMSGTDNNFRNMGSQDLIQWEAVKFFSDKVEYFDFEGSMIENIESNFRKFGTVQKQYFNISDKSILSDIKSIINIILKR